MKQYFSYSEFYQWNNYRDDFYKNYIEGKDFEPTDAMKLGSLVHKAIEEPNYPWKKELKELGMAERSLAIRKILDRVAIEDIEVHEKKLFATTPKGIELFGILDGFSDFGYMNEFKTTDNSLYYNQRVADCQKQMSFYAYMYWLSYFQYFKRIRLMCLNVKKGTVQFYDTVRSSLDLKKIEEEIHTAVAEMKAEGVWEKRLSREERAQINQTKLNL